MNPIESMYFNELRHKYGKLVLNRAETAETIGISLSQLDKLLRVGLGLPSYKRIGKSQKARIIFPLDGIAKFLASTSTQGGYFQS
jgi:hypothetical protein